jgi:thiol-disulfide isomerase/thioredoxin
MQIEDVEFTRLERELSDTGKSLLDYLGPDIGKVYVVAITREGCPACQKQKPRLDKLASTLKQKHRERLVFFRIHVKRPPASEEESLRSKRLLGHYFYPTNLILLRTRDRGAVEYYRSVSPAMGELKRNIEIALATAASMEKAAEQC